MINLDRKSLGITELGLITGRISIVIENISFPERTWSDSAAVVLTWWSDEMYRLFSNMSTTASLLFMDGPFKVILLNLGPLTRIDFLHSERKVNSITVDSARFRDECIQSLLFALNEVVQVCSEKKWSSSDVENVKRSIRKISSIHPL